MASIIKVDQIQSDTGVMNLSSGLVYINENNRRVGIGNTSPSQILEITDTAPRVNFISTNNDSGARYNTDGTATNSHRWQYQGVTQLGLTSGGTLDLPYGQIKFPSSQNASSDANTLDDYEEGTFTPVLQADGGGTFTQTVQYGRYVKIGQVVHFNIYIVWSAYSGSGSAQLTNYPFSIDWGTARQRAQAFPVTASSVSATQGYIFKNDTNGLVNNSYLYNFTDTSIIAASTLGASGWISVRGTYFTS